MTGTCSMPDAKTAVPIGRTPFLGENPRPAKMFLDTSIEKVAGHASREGHWGWDGASLESVSGIAHDPIGYFLHDEADNNDENGNGLMTPAMVSARKRLDMLGIAIDANSVDGKVNDFNLYRYVGNSPLLHTDPSGEHTAEDCDRWYEQDCARVRKMPNKTWGDRNRRRIAWAAAFARYSACLGSTDTAVKCYCVVGGTVAVGAAIYCTGGAAAPVILAF